MAARKLASAVYRGLPVASAAAADDVRLKKHGLSINDGRRLQSGCVGDAMLGQSRK